MSVSIKDAAGEETAGPFLLMRKSNIKAVDGNINVWNEITYSFYTTLCEMTNIRRKKEETLSASGRTTILHVTSESRPAAPVFGWTLCDPARGRLRHQTALRVQLLKPKESSIRKKRKRLPLPASRKGKRNKSGLLNERTTVVGLIKVKGDVCLFV